MSRAPTISSVFGKGQQRPTRVEMKHAPTGSFSLDTSGLSRKGRFAVAAKEDRTVDGETFDSKREAARYSQLKLMQRAGMIDGLELQPFWVVEINGQRLCKFTADFSYFCKERGRLVIEDVKSTGTQKDAAYRLRKKAAQLYFGIKVDEVIA
jgi:hypothetical protein